MWENIHASLNPPKSKYVKSGLIMHPQKATKGKFAY